MKITFLGTGTSQGIPVIGSKHPVCLSNNPKDTRLRTSALIQWNNKNIVIDCGPDFRAQMLNSGCDRVDAIFFTHEHNDHVSGLDDIRPFYFRQGNIPIYASERVIHALNKRFDYIFKNEGNIPGTPNVTTNIIDDNFIFNKQEVVLLNAFHGILPIHGFRFDNLAYRMFSCLVLIILVYILILFSLLCLSYSKKKSITFSSWKTIFSTSFIC